MGHSPTPYGSTGSAQRFQQQKKLGPRNLTTVMCRGSLQDTSVFSSMRGPVVDRLEPFLLEDFFYEYEHRSDLINLASSDALPWKKQELKERLSEGADLANFAYPDVRRLIIPGLEAVCKVPNGWSVLPTIGAAEAIAVAIHELAVSGKVKAIGIPSPSYGAFFGLARLLGIDVHTYCYQRECDWAINESKLMRLAEECDAIVVVNPHNPTGQRIEDVTLHRLVNILVQRDRTLLVDEVFRIEGEKSAVTDAANAGCDVEVVGSLSKTYGLPGLRLGWVIARENRISRMRTIQQYLTLSPAAPTAALARDVLNNLGAFSRAELINNNRNVLLKWAAVNKDRVSISAPQGGTTVAIQFKPAASEGQAFDAFIKAGVLLVPGSRFGLQAGPVWFRLGYGTETSKLKEGLERLTAALNRVFL